MRPGGTPGIPAGVTTGTPRPEERNTTGSPNSKNLEKLRDENATETGEKKDKNESTEVEEEHPGDNQTPWRPKTLSLPIAGKDVLRQDYIQALKDHGIEEKNICCVQRTASRVMVTLKNEVIKQDLLDVGLLQVAGQNLTVQDAQSSLTFVTIFDAPYELPDEAISRILRPYGRVKTHRRQIHRGTTIETGVRTVRMNIDKPIPSYIRVGKMLIGVKYEGQEATCKKCDQPGHKQWQCHLMKCYNCGEMGHAAVECDKRACCSLCTSPRHFAYYCPHNWLYQDEDENNNDDDTDAQEEMELPELPLNPQNPATTNPQQQPPQTPKPPPLMTPQHLQTPPSSPIPTPDFWQTTNARLLLPPQLRKGSGRPPAKLDTTTNAPTRQATRPTKTTTMTPLEEELRHTATKNTNDETNNDGDNDQMEVQSTCSKRSRSSSIGTSSEGDHPATDTSQERTLESAPPTPEKKPPGPTAPTLAVKHLRRKHRPKRTKNNKS